MNRFYDGIQAYYRYYRAYSYYKSLQKAAIVTQCGWRRRVARKELRSLKMVYHYFIKKKEKKKPEVSFVNKFVKCSGCKGDRGSERGEGQTRETCGGTYMAFAAGEAIKGNFVILLKNYP